MGTSNTTIAEKKLRTRVPASLENEYGKASFTVTAELHSIGGQKPYFAVTVSSRDFGGCCHDLSAKVWPEISGFIPLHLSDENGTPMHAKANGLYWIQQAYQIAYNLDCKSVGLNPLFHKQPDPKSFEHSCSHFRVTPEKINQVFSDIENEYSARLNSTPMTEYLIKTYPQFYRDPLFAIIEKHIDKLITVLTPEWKNQADQFKAFLNA